MRGSNDWRTDGLHFFKRSYPFACAFRSGSVWGGDRKFVGVGERRLVNRMRYSTRCREAILEKNGTGPEKTDRPNAITRSISP